MELINTCTEADFTTRGADVLEHHLRDAIEQDGDAIMGLSGGSTPRAIYEELGKRTIDWNRVSIFLVDERYVPASDMESNQFLIRTTLLQHANIPAFNIIFPDTTLPIEACIEKYAKDLHRLWDKKLPDVLTLGMGDDGHIASLFPPLSDASLGDGHLVLHTVTDAFPVHDRITLSLNALAAAGTQVFCLKGVEKKRAWDAMLASEEDERRWPAKRILEHGAVTLISLSMP